MAYLMKPFRTDRVPYFFRTRLYNVTKFFLGVLNERSKVFTEYLADTACRETVTNFYLYRLYHNEIERADYVKDGIRLFSTPSIGIGFRSNHIEDKVRNLNKIVELLNKFEKKMHWKQTKAFPIEFEGVTLGPDERLFLIRFSKCWVNNPYFLYIYLGFYKLTIFGSRHDTSRKYLRQTDSLEQLVEELTKRKLSPPYQHLHLWLDIIKQRKRLFKGFSRRSLYLSVNTSESSTPLCNCGIATLCRTPSNNYSLTATNKFRNEQGKKLGSEYKKWLERREQCTPNYRKKSKTR